MPGPPRGSYPTDAFKGLNGLYFSSESLASAAKTAAAEALGMQTSKLSRPVGALQRELVVRCSIEPVRHEEVIYHSNPAASAAPT